MGKSRKNQSVFYYSSSYGRFLWESDGKRDGDMKRLSTAFQAMNELRQEFKHEPIFCGKLPSKRVEFDGAPGIYAFVLKAVDDRVCKVLKVVAVEDNEEAWDLK